MKRSHDEIRSDVMILLKQLSEDWEYGGEITENTFFLADMGLQSLDVVVLAEATQQHYGTPLPFTELFAEIGQRPVRDLTVGEWVEFLCDNLNAISLTAEPGGES